MLTYVPVVFDVYRPLKAHLRWTLQCLVGFADHSGKCWPSVRTLAEVTGIGKSTVSRHLAELTRTGILSRSRKPGGVYVYRIDSRFLPAGAKLSQAEAKVSQTRAEKPDRAVPPAAPEEKTLLEENTRRPNSHVGTITAAPLDSETFRWRARLRQWRDQELWVASYGPRPNEPGCRAPRDLLVGIFDQQPRVRDRASSGIAIAR
jgi:DNA-binding transcriptional ArsR family regulator